MSAPSPAQQAAVLHAADVRVMPLWADGTRPDGFGSGNPEATWPPDNPALYPPNASVAILCGPCPALAPDWLAVLDRDGDPEDNAAMASFEALLPPTLTGHDGAHRYYRVRAQDVPRLGQWGLFKRPGIEHDGFDLKWAGGYVRSRWTWSTGDDGPAVSAIATLPAEVIAAIEVEHNKGGARVPRALPASGDQDRGDAALASLGFDPAQVREDAVTWLRSSWAPKAVSGAGSNTMLIVVGGLMVGFGLDDETTLTLLIDEYAPLAWPDEEPDQEGFEHKIDEIDQKGSERFEPWSLACAFLDARRGLEWTRSDEFNAALATLPTPSANASIEEIRAHEERLATWNARLLRTAKGEIRNTVHNTMLTLEYHHLWHAMFGYDEFAHEVVFLRDAVGIPGFAHPAGTIFNEDQHPNSMLAWFGLHAHQPTPSELISAVHDTARGRSFHAVRDYLDGLRDTWDGVDRNLADYLGAEQTPYHRAVCAKWLRSAVARAMVPGAKADNMLILEGRQGAKKSTAIKCLCPDVRWFYEAASRDVGGKDFMQDMNGKWLCEIPEVDQLIKSRDESELKALLSRTTDKYRPSYGRRSQDFLRQLVFAGTTNQTGYLRDETGNRRYHAVACGEMGPIRDAAICDDRDQLWAQAVTEYDAGLPWWLTPDETVLAEDEQHARLEEDPWTEPVWAWIAGRGDDPWGFTVKEALSGLPGAKPDAEQSQADVNRMGKVLTKMGLICTRKQDGGSRRRVWCPPG